METPEELITKCKRHLNDAGTPQQWYKVDIRMLIKELERALSIADVVNRRELLIAFAVFLASNPMNNYCDKEDLVDEFLKGN